MIPLLLLAAAGAPQDFAKPMDVVQPLRIELTPALDGKIDAEEWDPLTPGTYLQWEPGKLYVAGEVPTGKDLVLSFDAAGDGWLVGDDNYEFRISFVEGKANLTIRQLDATAIKQPVWRERKDFEMASTAVATADADRVAMEGAFADAGLGLLPLKPSALRIRVDLVDSGPTETYLPRVCPELSLVDFRPVALPREMRAGLNASTRAVVPGESLKLRLTFNGTDALGAKSVQMRTLGPAGAQTNRMSLMFPKFDRKGRAFIDYATTIDPAATEGWRVMRATIDFADGPTGMVETSYWIAPFFHFTIPDARTRNSLRNGILRIPYIVELDSMKSSKGIIRVEPPEGWQVTRGDGDGFASMGGQTRHRRVVEFKVPEGTHGTFPIRFTGETAEHKKTQTCYFTIR